MKIPATSGSYSRTIDEFDFNGDEVELQVEVEYRIESYWSGDYMTPPEGGGIEDKSATVTGIAWFGPCGDRLDREATADELKEANRLVEEREPISDEDVFEHANNRHERYAR